MSRSTEPLAPGRVRYQAAGHWGERSVLIERLREWAERFGEPPRSAEWASVESRRASCAGGAVWRAEHPHWPHSRAVVRMFGSWHEGLLAAGLQPSHSPWPKGPLKERYERAMALRAEGLSQSAIGRRLGVSQRTIHNYINAERFCPCGAPIIFGTQGLCRDCSARQKVRRFTAAELVEAALRWRREHGRLPRSDEWREQNPEWLDAFPAWPSFGSVVGVFGRWSAMTRAAGELGSLFPLPAGISAEQREELLSGFADEHDPWPKDRVAAALRTHAERHGRAPEPEEWSEPTAEHPSAAQAARAFTTWPRALEAAGLLP